MTAMILKILSHWLWPLSLPLSMMLFWPISMNTIFIVFLLTPGYFVWCLVGLLAARKVYETKKTGPIKVSLFINVVGMFLNGYFLFILYTGDPSFH